MLNTRTTKRALNDGITSKPSNKRLKNGSDINYDVTKDKKVKDEDDVISESCDKSELNTTIIDGDCRDTKCVAVDCEMVGVGEYRSSALARCSLVNYHGDIIYDMFVKPDQPVTDYRTKWSGIRECNLRNAISFSKARKDVRKLIKNKILVGHSMRCDLNVLNLFHPMHLLRDTSQYLPIRLLAGLSTNNTPSLKDLTSILLNKVIQDHEHCSVEDARATMALYKLCETQWEQGLRGELSNETYLSDLYWPAWTRNDNLV